MRKSSVRDVRANLSSYLSAAEHGEVISVTRHGREVARIVPPETEKKPFPDLTAFRKSVRVKGAPASRVIRENRDSERY